MTSKRISDEQFRTAARKLYGSEGEVEFDNEPISRNESEGTDDGAYVHAWIWIDNAEAREHGKKSKKGNRAS